MRYSQEEDYAKFAISGQ